MLMNLVGMSGTTTKFSFLVYNFSKPWSKNISMSVAISKGQMDEADMVRQESCFACSNPVKQKVM